MKNTLAQLLTYVYVLLGLSLLWIGVQFILSPQQAEQDFGITFFDNGDYAFQTIKGIRDIFSGLLILTFTWLNWRKPLVVVLAGGILITLTDAWVVYEQAGRPVYSLLPHLLVSGICGIASVFEWLFNRNQAIQRQVPVWQVIRTRLGETFWLRKTSNETQGEYVEVDIELAPHPHHRPLHHHPRQSEYFQVLEGTLHMQVGGEVKTLHKGDEITILPGTPHYYWNNKQEKVLIKTKLYPVLNFEKFLLTLSSLETQVPTDAQGIPVNKLIAAQLVYRFRNIMVPSLIPTPVRLFLLPVISFAGKLAGFRLPALTLLLMLLLNGLSGSFAQGRFSRHELSVNGFRNPSIGLEYRYRFVSVHAGYYVTNFESNTTTRFYKTGATLWFLPVGKRQNPSSFYTQLSYLRGLNREYKSVNASSIDVGFRWMVWRGLNVRLGVLALFAKGKDVQINPTPGIGYAIFF